MSWWRWALAGLQGGRWELDGVRPDWEQPCTGRCYFSDTTQNSDWVTIDGGPLPGGAGPWTA